ncbi:MAG: GNAT family N-acetyltransferase, partial [Burkholderiaceae bacterium]
DALLQGARERGDVEVQLSAQLGAQAFYARAGFAPVGPPFEEAGIPHIEMSRSL